MDRPDHIWRWLGSGHLSLPEVFAVSSPSLSPPFSLSCPVLVTNKHQVTGDSRKTKTSDYIFSLKQKKALGLLKRDQNSMIKEDLSALTALYDRS